MNTEMFGKLFSVVSINMRTAVSNESILAVKTGLLAFKRLYFASLGSKFYYPSAYISLFLINFWGSAPSSVEKSKICCILYDAPYFLIFDKLLKLCPFIYWFGDLVRSLWCLQFQLFSNQYREFEMHSTTCLLNQQNIISFEAVVIHSHSLNLLEKHPAFHWTPFLVGRLTFVSRWVWVAFQLLILRPYWFSCVSCLS